VGLDQSLPLSDERAELVGGEVHAVECGEALLSLDFVDDEFQLAVSLLLVSVEVGEACLNNAALQGIAGDLCIMNWS
jgi:hypothetical protein